MRHRAVFLVLALVFFVSQLSYAGVIVSTVTNLGNAELTYSHDAIYGNSWEPWNRAGNNANYTYGCCPNWSVTTWTYLQVALPSYTGNITEAKLYVNVTGFSNTPGGDAAVLFHTSDSSSATGDATQGLPGNILVETIHDPAMGWLGLDVTSFILNDYSQNHGWAAFEFDPAGGNGVNSSFSFSLADIELPGTPYLSITTDAGADAAVPEPGTLLLFALGGTALLLRDRFRQTKG